jgi:hypothetical protein
MPMDLGSGQIATNSEPSYDARSRPRAEPRTAQSVRPYDRRPLNGAQAVDAAEARLNESWVFPDTTGHMVASGLAQELAATLCAYGMVGGEVAQMEHRLDRTASPLTSDI